MSRCLSVGLLVCFAIPVSAAERKLEYNRDVRPILAENCFACHGPDSASRQAGLRLDRPEDAIKAKALIPGKSAESGAIARIYSQDADELMPPPKSHKKLTTAQKEIVKRWIGEGAEYQPHWSFIAPKRAELPAVKNGGWVRNPIDRFILAELERQGLQPAAEADRRVLARRVSLDLTGLPPTPADVDEFVNDRSVDAYEKYVDKMLALPHWGEHRGRYWLDAARYGDTHGIHFDNFREMWAYRDWVISAFNRNQPFDQFTIEQLAGDLLPNRTLDQYVASGFNRCNITTNEGGAIAEEYLVLYTRDRTETASAVFMGLTTGCAVCHDHKFDPVSQREFYQLSAFFNNTTQGAMDGNIPNTPPIITVPKLEDRGRWEKITREVEAAKAKLEARKKESRPLFDLWLATAKPSPVEKDLTTGLIFKAGLQEGKGKEFNVTVYEKPRKLTLDSGFTWAAGRGTGKAFAIAPGGSLQLADVGDFEKSQPFSVSVWVKPTGRASQGAIVARMDAADKGNRGWDLWLQGDKVGAHIVSGWPDDALKVVSRNQLKVNQWTHVTMSYDGSGKAAGVKFFYNGEPQPVDVEADKLQGTSKTSVPFKIGQRHASDRMQNVSLFDIRIYDRPLNGVEAAQLAKAERAGAILAKPAAERTPQEVVELFDWWLAGNDSAYKTFETELAKLEQEEVALKSRGTIAHVMTERKEAPVAYILNRGEYDQRKDKVQVGTPKALPAFADDLPRNRLGLAQWLLRDDHPLTTRVTINRFWQELFGNGIVRTSGDFGIMGDLPSHPELLDWMAIEFREGGWDIKKFFKLMVTSAAYRQSAAVTKEKIDKDPANRLVSRGPRFRMDAEMIRDYALASSGLLVPKIGGPSVKPYQPTGVWEAVAMPGSNTRSYKQDTGENLYRRSMYTFLKRSAPPASMEIFNAPNRETCAVRRERTNTPLQALVTLNDPQFIEAAKVLAQGSVGEANSEQDRLQLMAGRLLARPLTAEEVKVILPVFTELKSYYLAHPDEAKKLLAVGEAKVDPKADAADLAAWTMMANQLMNLDEVLNK